jgi:hypothetical protein
MPEQACDNRFIVEFKLYPGRWAHWRAGNTDICSDEKSSWD